eukprot:SAG11_NODE_7235_length_1174_cov_1.573023_1_plen_95_part_00
MRLRCVGSEEQDEIQTCANARLAPLLLLTFGPVETTQSILGVAFVDAASVEVNGGVLIHLIRIPNKIEFFEKSTQNSVKKVPLNPIRISRHRSL